MSMAEPRRRKKWTLNPRGTLWANDESKFGQKLMEKMGWSKGRGLGREEQGMTEHIAVKIKDDSKGIGYKGSDDEWIKHYEGFESVLANLNSQENITVNSSNNSDNEAAPEDNNTVGRTSLESSSKASRVRVHYHKFTRGKDLSRCTEDDLGCILGSKRAKQLSKEKIKEEEIVKEEEEVVGHVEHSMGVTTIKGCSIQEYFAQKMEALKSRDKIQPKEEEKKDEEDGFNFRISDENTRDCFNDEQENTQKINKKKKEKKNNEAVRQNLDFNFVKFEERNNISMNINKECEENEYINAMNGEINKADNNEKKIKKKRKRTENSAISENNINSNEGIGENNVMSNEKSDQRKKEMTDDNRGNSEDKSMKDNKGEDKNTEINNKGKKKMKMVNGMENKGMGRNKNKKRKRVENGGEKNLKHDVCENSPVNISNNDSNIDDSQINKTSSESMGKNKKRKKSNNNSDDIGATADVCEDGDTVNDENEGIKSITDEKMVRKKRKNKGKERSGGDGPADDDNLKGGQNKTKDAETTEDSLQNSETINYGIQKTKRTKNNVNGDDDSLKPNEDDTSQENERKERKKKKKKKRKAEETDDIVVDGDANNGMERKEERIENGDMCEESASSYNNKSTHTRTDDKTKEKKKKIKKARVKTIVVLNMKMEV